MSVGAVSVVLAAMLLVVVSMVRKRQDGRYRRRIHSPDSRFLHQRNRWAGIRQGQELARAIIEDRPDPLAHLAAGVILKPGEHAWAQARTRLAVRSGPADWTVSTPVSWPDHGEMEWLITNRRLVGRLPANSEMLSLWWTGVAGADIDLRHDRIVLNGINGWTSMLAGPAVAPIAVAFVAMCHGNEALLVHPALRCIRCSAPQQAPPHSERSATEIGATIVRLRARRTLP